MVILQLGSPVVVKGSSKDLSFPGGFPVHSFVWGLGSPALGGGSSHSNPGATQEATFLAKTQDFDAPTLWNYTAKGKGIDTVKVNFLAESTGGTSGYQVILSNVVVSSIQPAGAFMQFTLNFTAYERRFLMKL